MITGDFEPTALAISKEIGLVGEDVKWDEGDQKVVINGS